MDGQAEVIITSDASNKQASCTIYDAKTETLLATYKGSNSAAKTLALISNDYLISASIDKPRLNIWTVSKELNKSAEFACPGSVVALSVSNCGTYCIGAIEKNIYVWKVSTGDLLVILDHHYQNITCFRFTTDDCFFLSGGEDGMVLVWVLPEVIAYPEEQKPQPHYSWCHHSARVTDIHIGLQAVFAQVATTSRDMTCKLYELVTGNILCTVCMDVPLTSVVVDNYENSLILGAENGKIYKVNICELSKSLHYSEMLQKSVFEGHKNSITCLSVSFTSKQLLSGSNDSTCKVWDIETSTCLRTLRHEGPITNAFFALRPCCLTQEKQLKPTYPIKQFSRHLISQDDQDEVQTIYMPAKQLPIHLSLMHAGSPDNYFNSSILYGSEHHVDEGISGIKDAYRELRIINAQLYAHLLNTAFNDIIMTDDESD